MSRPLRLPCGRSLTEVFGLLLLLLALAACRPSEEPSGGEPAAERTAGESTLVQPPAEQPPTLPFLLGGIQLNEEDHDRWAAALLQAGMNTVQVTVYAQQGAWDGAELWFEDAEPSVRAEIRAAHRHGLEVVLVLRVALSHDYPSNRFLWHGLIWPDSDVEVTEWFERYSAFVLKWAEIAEQEGVRVLGIGSEMNALAATIPVGQTSALTDYYLDDERQRELRALVARHSALFGQADLASIGGSDFSTVEEFLIERNRAERAWARSYTFDGMEDSIGQMNARRAQLEGHWRGLIENVREAYGGTVTFAANFDNYHEVAFWDALDLIGVNAYFPLRQSPDGPPSEAALGQAWSSTFEGIAAFSAERGLDLPVIFTELGYTQRGGATAAPWSRTGFVPIWEDEDDSILVWSRQPIVPDERAAAVRALHTAWRQDGFPLVGILYWKLSSRFELGRYEPFMLNIGPGSEDPLLPALAAFARAEVLRHTDALPRLHLAARRGDLAGVRTLLESGADTSARDPWGALALHWSCHQEHPQMAELLMPGTDVAWQDEAGETPVGRCARLDNLRVTQALLRLGRAHSATTPSLLVEPLRRATDQSSLAMVSLLLEAGAPPDELGAAQTAALHVAARRGDSAILERQLENSANALVQDRHGFRPVDHAAYYGRSDTFAALWSLDVEQAATQGGSSLLHHAAHGGDVSVIETLLDAGFDVERADSAGRTPLHSSVSKGHVRATSVLLSRGANPAASDGTGESPLHIAAAGVNAELLQLLLDQQPAVDLLDGGDNTALHYAAGWGRVENVRALLEAGASADLQNTSGQTALDVATELERRRVEEILRSLGAPP